MHPDCTNFPVFPGPPPTLPISRERRKEQVHFVLPILTGVWSNFKWSAIKENTECFPCPPAPGMSARSHLVWRALDTTVSAPQVSQSSL